MLSVYKYSCPLSDSFDVVLPAGAQLLTFQAQHEEAWLWALVDTEAPPVRRSFRLAGTGHPIKHAPADLRYVGTAQFRHGTLVFHLFEVLS